MGYTSPTKRDPQVQTAPDVMARIRVSRRPQMHFNLVQKPFQIQPCFIMPVFPGEGLKNMLVMSQVWSDPLANGMKNIGWQISYNVFYVKWRDLAGWDQAVDTGIAATLVDMMLNNNDLAPFVNAAGTDWSYSGPGSVDFMKLCLARVVDEYFRDEGEKWDDYLLDNVPKAQIYQKGRSDPFERLTKAANYANRQVAVPTNMSDLDYAWQEWQAMRDMGMQTMDFHDWVKAYGVNIREDENSVNLHRPEDIAHYEQWEYPTNTVEPTTGLPSTAAGWRIHGNAGKYKFFREPGWLIGMCTIRPKVYLSNQQGTMSGYMQSRADWMPPQKLDAHTASHKLFAENTGPLKNIFGVGAGGYWVDLRDYLNYGEQFINYGTPASGYNGVPFMELPAVSGLRRYPTDTEIMALFSNTTTGRFRQDGVVSLNITGVIAQNNDPSLTMAQR